MASPDGRSPTVRSSRDNASRRDATAGETRRLVKMIRGDVTDDSTRERFIRKPARPYTGGVSQLAGYLRDRAAEDVRGMDPHTRIRVALELGDADLARYCAANSVDPVEGRRRLMQQRQTGRRPSVVAHR